MENIRKGALSFAITAIQVLIVDFVIEWIYRGSFAATFEWIEEETRHFAYNFLFLFLLFGSFHIFKRKLYILFSFITTSILFILAIACNIKQSLRGEPVVPLDLSLGQEAANMANIFSNSVLIALCTGFLIIVILVGFVIYKVPNQVKRNWVKITTAFLFLLSFLLIINNEVKNENTFLKTKFFIRNNVWIQSENYQTNGVVASFILNTQFLKIDQPNNYTKNSLENIINNNQVSENNDSDKPNIIMIMSEAFWDPTILENVEFNKDPLPFFHKLQEENSGGQLLVPVFGGSTANTEFEALSGISTQLLPTGSIPYLHYLNRQIPALPYLLREQGYDTTAIHSFHHWFYNRSKVYKNLGFNRFISVEFMENPVPVGPYTHDSSITDEILKKLNMSQNQPNFIFAVTTQNHGPYSETEKMPYANIEINNKQKKGLSKKSINMLEVYSDTLSESDKELERLITELEKMDKKTMVVFFGDHLPLLGENYKVYKESGYYQENKTYEEYLKMYSTPIMVWDNFSGKREKLNIGSTMVSPMILDRSGLKGDNLTDYLLNHLHKGELSKMVRNDFRKKDNTNDQIIDEIKLLQYDMLFGKQYGLGNEQLKPNNKYTLGYGKPVIKEVSIENEGDETFLHLKGENFSSYSNVYINGTKVEKRLVDGANILVPDSGLTGKIEIVVKVSDSYEKVLSESIPYKMKN